MHNLLCLLCLGTGPTQCFIIPDIMAEYAGVNEIFIDICTEQGTPTLDKVKNYCLDLIECVFNAMPHANHHKGDIEKAKSLPELGRIVSFRLSKWISYDFLKKVITHFQPALKTVLEQLMCYEKQLKPLLQQKLEDIAELKQRYVIEAMETMLLDCFYAIVHVCGLTAH